MGKRPSMQWYPGDWMKDPEVRAVSRAARGLWVDMLCLMFECDRRGYLLVGGKPPTLEQLTRMTGGGSTEEVSQLLAELESAGVYSKSEDGTIYNRRMVRDETERRKGLDRMNNFRSKGGGDPARWTATRVRILERDKYLCAYCGLAARTVDHVVPRDRGGETRHDNLVSACKKCNSRKGDRTMDEAGMTFRPGYRIPKHLTPHLTPDLTAHPEEEEEGRKDNSSSPEKEGGCRGEGETARPPPADLAPEWLAREFCTRFCGPGVDDRNDRLIAQAIAELIRRGVRPEEIRNAILAKDRLRTERWWQFEKRWDYLKEGTNGHTRYRETKRYDAGRDG